MRRIHATLLLSAVTLALAVPVSPCGAADMPEEDAAITPATVPPPEPVPQCPKPRSPVAGAWVTSFWTPTETIIQTFKFAPTDDKCKQFVLNSQMAVRPAKVIKAFPEADSMTEFVGNACEIEPNKVDFTAIAYGMDQQVVFIAILTGRVDLVHKNNNLTTTTGGAANELDITVNIAFYAAEQDQDHDGFPDTRDALICVCYTSKLKRVLLEAPCEPSDSFVACLEPCWNCDTEGSGRAIFKLTDSDRKMFFVLKVKDVTDATYARIHISETAGEIGAAAVSLFPLPPQTGPRPGTFTGMLSSGTFSATDFIGPLKGKTMQDLVEAIADYRAFVVVATRKNTVAEICGAIVDP